MRVYIPEYTDTPCIASIVYTQEDAEKVVEQGRNAFYLTGKTMTLLPAHYEIAVSESTSMKLLQLEAYDVVEIDERGILQSLYQNAANSNALVVGMPCNSNCLMCPYSEQSRRMGRVLPIEKLLKIIEYIPCDAPYLTVTGGEPTLLHEFFTLVRHLCTRLPNTFIQYLTNGRAFANSDYGREFRSLLQANNRVAIPLHGPDADLHDAITQSPGSFAQTVRGIKQVEGSLAELEIRIVVSRLNYGRMTEIAQFLIQTFHQITCVNFMGMEMLGNAVKNADKVWIDYEEAFLHIRPAIELLIEAQWDVELYNFPFCAVGRSYWGICVRSISDYKTAYEDECDKCTVRQICGGFFESTGRYGKLSVRPVKEQQ